MLFEVYLFQSNTSHVALTYFEKTNSRKTWKSGSFGLQMFHS